MRRRKGETAGGPAGAAPGGPAHALEEVVGSNVRAERRRLDLTAKALAARAGISVGMLSKIESGTASPSLHTLRALSSALNVPVVRLFAPFGEDSGMTHVPAGGGRTIERVGSRARQSYRLLGGPIRGDLHVEPCMITIDESSQPYARFRHEGLEFIHVLEGAMTYRHGGSLVALKKGDSLLFEAESLHGPESFEKLPLRFLSLIAQSRK